MSALALLTTCCAMFLGACLVVLVVLIIRAPRGVEDESGFHEVE